MSQPNRSSEGSRDNESPRRPRGCLGGLFAMMMPGLSDDAARSEGRRGDDAPPPPPGGGRGDDAPPPPPGGGRGDDAPPPPRGDDASQPESENNASSPLRSASGEGSRRALLIGINDYQHDHISKLQGCVNDIRLMQKTLLDKPFEFPPDNVTVLEDAQATREGILQAFDRFVEQTGQNDIVVIHYAGHGSQMTDREGDEPSGYDSTIMPIDSPGWRGDNKDITDDEIHLRLARLAEKTPYITLIFDCCHSGTISRDDFGTAARTSPPDRRPVEELPPSPIPQDLWAGMRESGPSGWMPLADKYVLMAGCRDEEVSYEYSPPEGGGTLVHGALTYFLVGELMKARSGMTYRDVFERTAAKVNANNGKQHPQMEGMADREIFGVRVLEPMTFFQVSGRSGSKVELAGGAAHGVTVGSKFGIYEQGTKNTTDGVKLGDVTVTKVRAVTSDAEINGPETPAGAIVVGTRAFETEHAFGAFTFGVEIVGGEANAADLERLRGRLAKSTLVREVEQGTTASARIYALQPRSQASPSDPVPQLGSLTTPVWAAVNADGQLLMSAKSLDAVGIVVTNLEKLARYRQALLLENPDKDSRLRGRFSLDLLRKTADGDWVVAEADADSGWIVYHEGDRIALRINSLQDENDEPAFVTAIDFGVSGAVNVVYPQTGAAEKLRPSGFFEHGTMQGREFPPLYIPQGFPFTEDGGAVEGVETVKLILTSTPVDFRHLTQSGMRGSVEAPPPPPSGGRAAGDAPPPPPGRNGMDGTTPSGEAAASSPLMALWDSAFNGPASRDFGPAPVRSVEDWTTVSKSFVLRRKPVKSLKSDGSVLSLGGVTIATHGLTGEVEVHPWRSDRGSAAELRTGALAAAMNDAGVDVRKTVEVGKLSEVPSGTRSGGPPAIELSLREPEAGYGQMVMTTDELGVISWHFASPTEPAAGSRGGGPAGGLRSYTLPGTPHAAPASSGKRGLVGAVGRKFLKELVFPLVDPVVGAVTRSFVASWEGKHRPYRVRSFLPTDYTGAEARIVEGDAWRDLGAGRSLLLVHGTFSRAHSAFGGMPKAYVESLHNLYGGRVFAIDHFTLSHDPGQNVRWLIDQLPQDAALDCDIICHSRGGLVSRMLTEKQSELSLGSRSLRIGKVIFVGTPNAGTLLADSSHVGDLIDTFTNLANFFPDVGVSDVVAGVIAVAKQLAVGAFGGLPGLQSMVPGGKFANELNAGERTGDTRYFALSSNYTATEPGLKAFAKDRLMDFVFKGGNDLVVPTDGVYADNGSGYFPIEDKVVYDGSNSVAHTAFFAKREAREKIMEWLNA